MKKLRSIASLFLLLAATSDVVGAADALEAVSGDAIPTEAVEVDIAKMKYVPAALEIEAGTVVAWTNSDAVPHNVQIGTPAKIMGAMLRTGQKMAIRFNEAGAYSYICTPHPFMQGVVKVKPKA